MLQKHHEHEKLESAKSQASEKASYRCATADFLFLKFKLPPGQSKINWMGFLYHNKNLMIWASKWHNGDTSIVYIMEFIGISFPQRFCETSCISRKILVFKNFAVGSGNFTR